MRFLILVREYEQIGLEIAPFTEWSFRRARPSAGTRTSGCNRHARRRGGRRPATPPVRRNYPLGRYRNGFCHCRPPKRAKSPSV
ncbi:MAG: hypothetical protein OXQ29_09765, partial [Rhodospirillaceae bacterium]|nr:hypothetical protein [Rhodospirillaceae bacterium]